MKRVPPFFSIGLTAYDRVDLLRQSVSSILDQTFADFELIIGNDNPARTLTGDDIGIQDSRLRIINQPRNLGQVGNWRSLLEHATGRYFTWIADDDLCTPDFLAACHATLAAHGFPECVYSSFDILPGQETVVLAPTFSGRSSLVSGSDLLWSYLLDEVRLLGNMGVFARDFLVKHTPWEEMECPGVALFREYLFVLLAAKLEKVAYIPDRLILYRDHAGSWGSSNVEIKDYHSAGKWLVKQSTAMLESAGDPAVQEQLVMLVFNLALKQIVSKRKNASFPVDVDALFNGFLGLPESSAKEQGPPDAIRTTHSWGRRSFLSLCRQYVVAETGRIEKDAELKRLYSSSTQMQLQLVQKEAELERLYSSGKQMQLQLVQKEAELERLYSSGKQMQLQLDQKEAELKSLYSSGKQMQFQLARKEAELGRLYSSNRQAQAQLQEKEAVIQELRKALDAYRSGLLNS